MSRVDSIFRYSNLIFIIFLFCFLINMINLCDMLVLCFMFWFYVIITNTMAYWYDGAALAATRSPVIALFWCLIKFTTTNKPLSKLDLPTLSKGSREERMQQNK